MRLTEEDLEELMGSTIGIVDEEGNEAQMLVMSVLHVEGNDYLCLLPAEQGEGDEEPEEYTVNFMRYDDNETLSAIESDSEWEKVSEAFEIIMEQMDQEE